MRNHVIEKMLNEIIQGNVQVINLYGDKGVGKSYFINQLKQNEILKKKYLCGTVDLEQYAGMPALSMVNALYDMCDFLYSEEAVRLVEFDIADRIDSLRNNRIPYTGRRFEKGLNTSVELTEFVSEFIELPYIGAGIKAAKAAARIVNKYRPKTEEEKALHEAFSKMDKERLHEYLPCALANDINHSKGQRGKKILMIVENAETADFSMFSGNWLNDLVEHIENIIWVFVTRKPLKMNKEVSSFEVLPMNYEEMEAYLSLEKRIPDQLNRYRIFTLSRGIPLYVERIIDLMNQKDGQHLDWEVLNAKGSEYIISETLLSLSDDRKEMLFQLSAARYFDQYIFKNLFPGRLFQVYKEWFDSSLFVQEDGKYAVQNTMKKEIQQFMSKLDSDLLNQCVENLYQAEMRWFEHDGKTAEPKEIGVHMQSLFVYAQQVRSRNTYYQFLMSIKNQLINAGCMSGYYEEISRLSMQKDETGIHALKEKALLNLYFGNYAAVRESLNEGICLCDQMKQIQLKLQFLNIQMNLEYISPSTNINSVQRCIETAEEYLNTLTENLLIIPYKTYMTDYCKIQLYLAKQHVIDLENDKAENCLNEIFKICEDVRKMSALSLYAICAKAQEQMGEILGLRKLRHEAIAMYQKSVETYQVAEVVQDYWDSDFYLNFGLVHKRMTEEYLHLALDYEEEPEKNLNKAFFHLDQALELYGRIKEVIPELLDTYSRMLFGCIEILRQLWKSEQHNDIVFKYIKKANQLLDEAFGMLQTRKNGLQEANRQLYNAMTMVSRYSALFYERIGMDNEAQKCYQKTLQDGQMAIQAAPLHPYGYTEAAQGYACYAKFLLRQKNVTSAYRIANEGLGLIQKGNQMVSSSSGFIEIQESLQQILKRCSREV